MFDDELSFEVVEWDERGNSVFRVHAKCSRFDIGQAAFVEAAAQLPQRRITLRQGVRKILDSTLYEDRARATMRIAKLR